MIDALRDVFGSALKSLDVFYVLEGCKPVSRILAKEEELQGILDFLEDKNLKTAVSDFKVVKEPGAANSYSDKGVRLNGPSYGNNNHLVYISKEEKLAKRARQYEDKNDHFHLGLSLGYPDCCSEFFTKRFPVESKKKNDYTLAVLENSENYTFPFQTNVAARFLDVALLSHFPCSFNCRHSKAIAEKNLTAIKKHSEEWHKLLSGMLNSVVLYSEENGIFLLRNFSLDKNKVFYSTVMASMNSEIYKQLKDAEYMEILGKNRIRLGAEVTDSFGVMVFQ